MSESRPYKVVSISIYNSDLTAADDKIAELKRRGLRRMNRSRLIRLALSRLDVEELVATARDIGEP